MPVNTEVRNKILDWIKDKKPYSKIIELVKEEGFTIAKGGITYIKQSEEKRKKQEEKTERETEQTEQEKKEVQATKEKIENHIEQVKELYTKPLHPLLKEKILSDLEFKLFKDSFKIVYNSNKKRLKSGNAHGILNSLENLKKIIDIIENRGNYS